MSGPVLVIGATGTVGRATVQALLDRGAAVTAFVRDPARGRELLGEQVALRVGGLADATSVRPALDGIQSVLLSFGHDPEMRAQQLNAVRAIADSDVSRVVKISASPVAARAGAASSTGADHLAVEESLRALACQTVAIRPNAFMQNFLEQAAAVGHGALPGPEGDPRVSFVDARDIGAVAATALVSTSAPEPVLEVTGPHAHSWFDVAHTMSEVLGRRVTHYPTPPDVIRQGLLAMGRPDWLVEHTVQMSALLAEPQAAAVTDTVARVSGREPITLERFLHDHASAFPALG